MDAGEVRVVGVVELRKALRDIDKDLAKELAAGLAEAADIVADEARAHVPRRSGRAADSIKVRKQSAGASLAVGGTKAPYYPWLDFGGTVGRGRVPGGAKKLAGGATGGHAGSVKRPFIQGGRYIYPALRHKEAQVKAKVDEVMARMATKAGFDTDGNSASG